MSECIHEEEIVSNEFQNIFALEKSTNIWANEYIKKKVWPIQISEYLLHTDMCHFHLQRNLANNQEANLAYKHI